MHCICHKIDEHLLEPITIPMHIRLIDLIQPHMNFTSSQNGHLLEDFRHEQIQLDGFARAASELIPKLEESERFKNVKFASPTTKAQERDRFSISMELE